MLLAAPLGLLVMSCGIRTDPNLSIFEYREHHWLRTPNCGRKTMDLIVASLKSLIGKRMELSNGNV